VKIATTSPPGSKGIAYVLGVAVVVCVFDLAAADIPCPIRVEQPDVLFPVDKMAPEAVCRMAAVVNGYTTHRIDPPASVPIPKSIYDFLLDHPVLTATLVRQLSLAATRISQVGADAYQGDDGQGGEGLVTVLYQDGQRRVYHIKGSQRSSLFPMIAGAAVVMLNYHPKAAPDGRELVETRIIIYSKLENPYVAMLVQVLRPILQRAVNNRLTSAVLAVHRLCETIAADPERVYREADALPDVERKDSEAFRALLAPSLKKGAAAP